MHTRRSRSSQPSRRRSRITGGAVAGGVAGVAMALFMMGWGLLHGESVWTNPNLIAVMWMGKEVAGDGLSAATLVGLATHMTTSLMMGIIAVPFIYGLPPWRTFLVAVIYALASYPLVFSAVMTWANPLMTEQAGLIPMTVAHSLFGFVLGGVYLGLRPDSSGFEKV